jgi:PhnB protein
VGGFGGTDTAFADKIMHSHLQSAAGFTFMAADLPPEMPHQPGNTISMTLSGDNGDELRGYWARLAEGGTVSVPLEKQMWGDEFGMCVDRFGIQWMINIGQPQS